MKNSTESEKNQTEGIQVLNRVIKDNVNFMGHRFADGQQIKDTLNACKEHFLEAKFVQDCSELITPLHKHKVQYLNLKFEYYQKIILDTCTIKHTNVENNNTEYINVYSNNAIMGVYMFYSKGKFFYPEYLNESSDITTAIYNEHNGDIMNAHFARNRAISNLSETDKTIYFNGDTTSDAYKTVYATLVAEVEDFQRKGMADYKFKAMKIDNSYLCKAASVFTASLFQCGYSTCSNEYLKQNI